MTLNPFMPVPVHPLDRRLLSARGRPCAVSGVGDIRTTPQFSDASATRAGGEVRAGAEKLLGGKRAAGDPGEAGLGLLDTYAGATKGNSSPQGCPWDCLVPSNLLIGTISLEKTERERPGKKADSQDMGLRASLPRPDFRMCSRAPAPIGSLLLEDSAAGLRLTPGTGRQIAYQGVVPVFMSVGCGSK